MKALSRLKSLCLGTALLAPGALPIAASAGTETVLYSFPANTGDPTGRLQFFGTSLYGTSSGYGSDDGQVFELTPSGSAWKETGLFQFDGGDGSNPSAGLIRNSSGILFGTTANGDAYGYGNVFELYKSHGGWAHETIWSFGGYSGDGWNPNCDLVMDSSGALYGTTSYGGGDYGTVFKLAQSGGVWNETVLYTFTGGSDGGEPSGGLLMDSSGALYGLTEFGGAYGGSGSAAGVAFELTQSGGVWSETVLHSFCNGSDGCNPAGALIKDSAGSLYGTTTSGANSNCLDDPWPGCGIVFKLTLSGGKWNETILHTFTGGSDGGNPHTGLTGRGHTIYGTTTAGGKSNSNCAYLFMVGCGTVFELTESRGKWGAENVLYTFTDGTDGAYPYGAIILDKTGAVYGTAETGGAYGSGNVWKVTP